jgi:diamine N-acetyltransferase
MDDVTLVKATPADADLISSLADKIWHQHYPAIISMDQIRYMLNMMYSRESLTDQMQNKGHTFFLIKVGGSPEGFISVHPEGGDNWFLNKFYINQQISARGIGSQVFNKLLAQINPAQLTLTVNRQNYKSINFYFKKGFHIQKVADFDIGNGYVMDDFVMVWRKGVVSISTKY